MHIVIEISEEDYKEVRKDTYSGTSFENRVFSAIDNGTPLPKGHGRLIDADNTISKICDCSCGCHLKECGHDEPCFSVTRIESATTIIEADKAESEEV